MYGPFLLPFGVHWGCLAWVRKGIGLGGRPVEAGKMFDLPREWVIDVIFVR